MSLSFCVRINFPDFKFSLESSATKKKNFKFKKGVALTIRSLVNETSYIVRQK